jgi:hypothetical protein
MRALSTSLRVHTAQTLVDHLDCCADTHCARWQAGCLLDSYNTPVHALQAAVQLHDNHWHRPLWARVVGLLELVAL